MAGIRRQQPLTGDARTEMAATLKQRYEANPRLSIAKLARELGMTYAFVRVLLIEAGTQIRDQRGWRGVPDAQTRTR